MRLMAALLATTISVPALAQTAAPADRQSVEAELKELRTMRESLAEQMSTFAKQMNTFDGRIDALENQLQATQGKIATAPAANRPASAPASTGAVATQQVEPAPLTAPGAAPTLASGPPVAFKITNPETWGAFEPGRGFVLARTDKGELSANLFGYMRYLNQLSLEPTYTDYFGNTKTLQLRQDLQFNKVNLSFKGWLLDPDFSYLVFIWTQNVAQGDGAQVVVAGNFGYKFSDQIKLSAGISALPTTRSTTMNFPNWLRNDNRPMADEFFRGSFTTGIWVDGTLAPGLEYRAMLGNNLSQLGISATQLDNGLKTGSAFLRWMPTTGEFGPLAGFGDFENHQKLATLFEAHYTYSRESSQDQPGTTSIENSQIRLSDGTRLFEPGVFGTDPATTRIKYATYQMAAADAAFKYKGFALEGEMYGRWLGNFDATAPLPYSSLFDYGFNLQASMMAIDKKLQFYSTFSQIWGDFGYPSEFAVGLNYYPFSVKNLRFNANALWLDKSPVGYPAVPYVVGGQGWVYYLDFIMIF